MKSEHSNSRLNRRGFIRQTTNITLGMAVTGKVVSACAGSTHTAEVWGASHNGTALVQITDFEFDQGAMTILVTGCVHGHSGKTGELKAEALELNGANWEGTGKIGTDSGVTLDGENIPDGDGVAADAGYALDVTGIPSGWHNKTLKWKVHFTPDEESTILLKDKTTSRTAKDV